ncbi:MAG: T9SS type A sorting domain-containing protein [Bacteroidia bacterium]|nr:T9SS type A sorting domain-containing protein [Bacteroidia bacterium]
MRLIILLTLSLAWGTCTLHGQTFFSVNDPLVYGGSCTNLQNNLGGNQPTAIWIDQNLILNDLASPTAIVNDFELYFGNSTESSQGVAVSIQQVGTNAIGGGGQAMGYGGTFGPSLTFEIDTNIGVHDSLAAGNNHLGLHQNGQYELPSLAGGPVTLPDLFDGNFHHGILTINWDPSNAANQYVSFSLDGIYSITYPVELSTIFDITQPLYVGGTSAPVGTQDNPIFASIGPPGSPGTCSRIVFPIELLDFSCAVIDAKKVQLNWETASEENFSHFSIERSIDQSLWQATGRVDGSGNQSGPASYKFVDDVKQNGIYYYRLKHVDIDGKYDYSKVLSVKVDNYPVQLSPNPTSDFLRIDLGSFAGEFSTIEMSIMDLQGRSISHNLVNPRSTPTEKIDVSGFNKGIYFLNIKVRGAIINSSKFVVE